MARPTSYMPVAFGLDPNQNVLVMDETQIIIFSQVQSNHMDPGDQWVITVPSEYNRPKIYPVFGVVQRYLGVRTFPDGNMATYADVTDDFTIELGKWSVRFTDHVGHDPDIRFIAGFQYID